MPPKAGVPIRAEMASAKPFEPDLIHISVGSFNMSYTLNIQNTPFFDFPAPDHSHEPSYHWRICFDPNAAPQSWENFLQILRENQDIENHKPVSIDFQEIDPGRSNVIQLFNLIFQTLFDQKIPDPEGLWYQISQKVSYEPPQGFEGRRRFTFGMWERHCQSKQEQAQRAMEPSKICATCKLNLTNSV